MLHGFRILRSASRGILILLQLPACFGAGSPGGFVAGGLLLAKATAAPALSRLAGLPSGAGYLDGPGAAARFDRPCGVAMDQAGDVYVADSRNGVIRRISPTGLVSTVPVPAGLLGAPASVAVDPDGNLYVADTGGNTVRKLTLAWVAGALTASVTTPVGVAGMDGTRTGALPAGFTPHRPWR